MGLATRQRRGWRPGGWGSGARAARAGRGEAGPGVGPADRGLRARARTGRRAAVGPGGQHGPHHHHPGKRSRAAAVPAPPPRAPHLRGRRGAARRRGRPAGTAAAGGGGVSWCGRSASTASPLGLSAARAVMALHFIRAPREGRGTHARQPWSRPATVDVASRRPGAGPAGRGITWPAGAGLPPEPCGPAPSRYRAPSLWVL